MSDRPAYTLHSLNGGELSRRFEARQDQNKYQSGVFKAENWTPLVLGGLKRRDGTIFVAQAKYSGQEELVFAGLDQVFADIDAVVVNEGGGTGRTTVLIPFIFNDEQAYMLEFGEFYVRFFKDGAPILVGTEPYELVTPYPSSMLRHIKMSAYQSADIMYIPSDGTLPMYKLRRIALDPDTFDIFPVNFKTPGSKESELTGAELGNSTLTPGATSGDGVTFTATNSPFLAGDVGMVIKGPFGASAIIDSFTSSSAVVADIVDPFVDTSPIAPEDWSLSGTPSANINPSRGKHGGGVTVTADADVFRDAYLGRYILVYGGLIEITRVNGPQKIRGLIRSDLIDRDKINPSETGFWSLEENAWTEEDGYPTTGCFYQERMIVARQQTRWASNTAQFENFAKGNDDSAGFARTLSDDQINDIRWLKASSNGLFSATANGVYQAQASTEGGPLTPNDFNEKPISNLGTANIAPLRVEGTLLYVQDAGRSLIEQAFNFIDNKFDSPDLLLRADHLTEFHTLTATAYQQKPDSIMVATRNDGQLLQMVYRRKEDVVGWAPIVTEGTILDVAVIPRPETGHDWVWIIVEREIGGDTLTYIEYFEGFNGEICREWRAAQTDSAMFTTTSIVDDLAMAGDDFIVAGDDFVTLADGEAIGIIGLGHLEGKEVWPIGDGMLFNKSLVTNGQITLAPQIGGIASFEVGIPYVSDGLTLEPVIPNEKGGPLMARGWEVAGARVRRTMGLSLNGERIPFRQATDNMDEQIPLKRGKVNVVVQKCDGEGRISFVQDLPFPAEILNIMGRVSIGDEPIPFLIPEETPPFLADCLESVTEEIGALQVECGHTCPLGQYAEMTYNGSTKNAGPGIRITPSSTRLAMFGLFAVYIPAQLRIVLMLYQGESTDELATALVDYFVTLGVNDVVRVESDLTVPTTYRVKLNGTTVISDLTIDDADLSTGNSCVGVIEIPESGLPIPTGGCVLPDTSCEIMTEAACALAGGTYQGDFSTCPPVGGEGDPDVIITKSADEPKTSDTTLADDTELFFAVAANEIWVGHAVIQVTTASVTPDIKLQFTGPAGSTGRYVETYNIFSDSDLGSSNTFGMTAFAIFVFDFVIVNGATPGNLSFQWSQNTSSADATTVKKGSALYAFKQA